MDDVTELSEAMVLTDADGSYYVVPKEVIEQGRVADENRGVVDELVGETFGFALEGLGSFSSVGWLTVPRDEEVGLMTTGIPFFIFTHESYGIGDEG